MLTVSNLRCDDQIDPLALEHKTPALSWQVSAADSKPGHAQSAYRILVASERDRLTPEQADIWDSGYVESSDCIHIPYNGSPLFSTQRCWWTVQVWDQDGNPSCFAPSARWEVGLLDPEDWTAQWIASADETVSSPWFRTEFTLHDEPVQARAYVCGLGYYELYINGTKVGDHVLDPAQTDYPERALYATYDVTNLLTGRDLNALGIWLGKGWFDQDQVWGGMSYGNPRVICLLRIEFGNGRAQTISTNDQWQSHGSPILRNNVYGGETYDARLEQPGWATPGFDASAWRPVRLIAAPTARLEAQTIPAIRRIRMIQPRSTSQVGNDTWVFDLGQNFAGWVRLRIRAERGSVVRMRFAETIDPRGMPAFASTGVSATGVEQMNEYICKGDGVEEWEPRFSYHGFRYVEVSGISEVPSDDIIEGVLIHSAVERAGYFECSDPLLNRIHDVAVWTQVSNLHGIPTDCPAREKCGWLGDAHVVTEMCCCNFDMARFWQKYIRDIETSWRHALPGYVAPGKRCSDEQAVDWAVAVVLIPWYTYLHYGDIRILQKHYSAMRRFVSTVRDMFPNGLIDHGLGDWCPPGQIRPTETPVILSSTALFYQCIDATARAAQALGAGSDACELDDLASKIRSSFHLRFYDEQSNGYGSQTANVLALCLGLVPKDAQQAVIQDLVRQINDRHSGHLATGIFGSKYLYTALSDADYGELALAMLRNTSFPSIGHLLSLGATTLWECWRNIDQDAIHLYGHSMNHPMHGAFDSWFFQGLGGINPSVDGPGYRHVLLRPIIPASLQFVRTRRNTPIGEIESSWHRECDWITWTVRLPPNATATAFLPFDPTSSEEVRVNGKPLIEASGVESSRSCDGPRPDSAECLTIGLTSGEFILTGPARSSC